MLEAYALISHESRGHHDTELAALMHRDEQVARADQQLRHLVRELLAEAAEAGDIRNDVGPDELVAYCLHALTAASRLPSKAAVRRLVGVTLGGMRPPLMTGDSKDGRHSDGCCDRLVCDTQPVS